MTEKSENSNDAEEAGASATLISHFLELRRRLLISVGTVLGILLALMPFQNRLFSLVAIPMLKKLPAGSHMVATHVASPFMTPLKLALFVSLFLAVPVMLYQVWAFVAPGLYKNERRMILPLLVSSVLLFYTGVAFAYFVLFPLAFAFLTAAAPQGVEVMTDIGNYLNFVLTIFFAFGVAFEVPVALVLAVMAGLTTPRKLARFRPYALVSAFIVGMLLTPPDVISQTLLALPMYLLFELGILFARIMVPGSREVDAQQQAQEQQQD